MEILENNTLARKRLLDQWRDLFNNYGCNVANKPKPKQKRPMGINALT